MKLPKLREFRPFLSRAVTIGQMIDSIVSYLSNEVSANFREITTVLNNLDLVDNFNSFEVEITIPATSELQIRNELQVIPGRWILVRRNQNSIVDGDTPWTINYVYLKNTAATTATAKVIFMR